jgi:hypothetical protein
MTRTRNPAREQRLRRWHNHRYSHALMLVQDKIVVVAEEKQLRRAASLPVSDNVAGLPLDDSAWRRYSSTMSGMPTTPSQERLLCIH